MISGEFNPDGIGEDEIILCVLRTDDTKENEFPGKYKEGTPLMRYETGDRVQIKYRKDLETDSEDYEKLTDTEAEYVHKTYRIAAIVSFDYMYDCNRTVYPLFITSDEQIRQIAPDSGFHCMYVNGKSGMSLWQQMELEQKLIRICSQNSNISTRSLISDIAQNEMFYHKQMLYVYGIAVVAFLLVMINMINNLRYRMRTRTKEISMLRAIGMSVAMTKRMLLFENLVLGAVSLAGAFVLSQPVLRYLYQLSDMRAFGHSFRYDYTAFAVVSFVTLFLCGALSFGIMKAWKAKKITEEIANLE